MKSKWINLSERKPEKGLTVEVKTTTNSTLLAYLCPHCGNEWRCGVSGGGLMIQVVSWRETEESKRQNTIEKKSFNIDHLFTKTGEFV